jgi:hypothetical protein
VVWYAEFLYWYQINPDTPPLFVNSDNNCSILGLGDAGGASQWLPTRRSPEAVYGQPDNAHCDQRRLNVRFATQEHLNKSEHSSQGFSLARISHERVAQGRKKQLKVLD